MEKIHLDREHLHGLYAGMLRIRRFEAKCVELYQAQKIRGFLHLYDGEEAVAVGPARPSSTAMRSSPPIAIMGRRWRAAFP